VIQISLYASSQDPALVYIGGFGIPMLRARNTETARAFAWELERTVVLAF
jgi:hypothetical protein